MGFDALQRRFAALLRMRSEQGGTLEEVSVGRRRDGILRPAVTQAHGGWRPSPPARRDQSSSNPLLGGLKALRVTIMLHFPTQHKFHCSSIDGAARIH